MSTAKMHVGEVETDATLVRRLLATQLPQWAALPIARVESAGTDNAIYRLGEEMAVRLPRIAWAVGQVDRETRWLPKLAPLLPLAVPLPLAHGMPGEGYPWQWGVYQWLEGENALLERLDDVQTAAMDLAHFIRVLRQIDSTGGPTPGPQNSERGGSLAQRDMRTRAAIADLDDLYPPDPLTKAWDLALNAPEWGNPPVWIHGDLQSGNLLAVRGRLSAVIDFGCMGVGDPACDLMVAWNLFTAETREFFRTALRVGDAEWARGRGWALSVAVIALAYYRNTNPALAGIARHTIHEVITDRS